MPSRSRSSSGRSSPSRVTARPSPSRVTASSSPGKSGRPSATESVKDGMSPMTAAALGLAAGALLTRSGGSRDNSPHHFGYVERGVTLGDLSDHRYIMTEVSNTVSSESAGQEKAEQDPTLSKTTHNCRFERDAVSTCLQETGDSAGACQHTLHLLQACQLRAQEEMHNKTLLQNDQ